ncbi:DNA polymerase III subunit alpha [Salirhabdus sp. Marseille-P4669]|uniref:DNA polymerase III subunit alpha n=1 Tax=Salirhabdus sp. Marseille-P4669 TaxID=2042310 RepID=UPI000C79CDB2|nr:DNA polymerase III subunit alpha [Salirhabdus sp. Marseille-P4669]
MGFVHLQANSGYSFMQSTLSVEKFVQGAKSKGFHSIALTDDFVLHGIIQFYKHCIAEGIKPLIGMKASFVLPDTEEEYTFILIAKSNKGYESLVKLSSYAAEQEFHAISLKNIPFLLQDLVVILPAFQGGLKKYLLENALEKAIIVIDNWRNAFNSDNFYLGVQDHGLIEERTINNQMKKLCIAEGYQATAIQDVRYLNEEDYVAYDCYRYMGEGKHWSHQKDMTTSMHRHLAREEEMELKFSAWPEVVQETEKIAEQCNVTFDFEKLYLPAFPTPSKITSVEYLRNLCEEMLAERYEDKDLARAQKRLQYELTVIEKMGFSDYFLIVWDFMKFAKENHILTGPGRGSAAGSIVAYLLHITEIDPLKYHLLFERFLNPERLNMPDIDIDFSDYRRDEVIKYVQEKYGADHVAQIITFGTFAQRSLLRELMKTMSIDEQDMKFLLNEISQNTSSLSTALQESEELLQYVKQSKKLQLLFKIAVKLEGLPRHHSTHAAGVIISKEPLSKIVPVIKGHQDISLTQYPMNDLEQIGLLKMDFLGLRNLTLMEQIIKRVRKNIAPTFTLEDLNLNDSKTFRLLQEGKTTGVFQLESQGMRRVLKELKPTAFEDIVAVNALYRPGPMEFIPTYIKRKHGREKVQYPHPNLQPILESTFGVLVYQEQIMQIANQFAGLSLGEADLLRRAVSKKKKEIIDREKEVFISGCLKKGYKLEIAEEIYNWIVRFADYGFNKSHAVAYSLISYQLAYLKAHYPAHFFSALLSSVTYDQDKVSQYVQEAKDFGISILPPSINKSSSMFTVENNHEIRMALPIIKGVGKNAVDAILEARKGKPFSSLFNFCQRVPLKTVNRGIIENLILAGCFDETHSNRATLLASIDQAIEQGELFGGLQGQSTLFDEDFMLEPSYTEVDEFPALKRLAYEKEIVGMYVSSHPLATYRNHLRNNGFLPIHTLKEKHLGNNAKVVISIQQIKVIRTKRGDQMAFVTLGDETDTLEGVLFPNVYREAKQWLMEEMLLTVQGKLEWRRDKAQMLINQLSPFNPEQLTEEKTNTLLYIKLLQRDEREQLEFLKDVSEKFPGNVPVVVHSQVRKETYQLASQYNLKPNSSCIKTLKNYFGQDYVVLQKK